VADIEHLSTPGLTTVRAPIVCIECRRPWLDASERWRIYVLHEDPPEAVPYCDVCALREFG
jgi:hypothetical protein